MRLSDILENTGCRIVAGDAGTDISSVEYDSRKITRGGMFVAIKGFTSDGHDYVESCVSDCGAAAVLVQENNGRLDDSALRALSEKTGCVTVAAADTRRTLAQVTAAISGHPEEKLRICGITGTKGKTTSTFMLRAILEQSGIKAGLMGTVVNMVGDKRIHSEHTTPESHEIYSMMRGMVDSGATDLVMEVSSQGLKLDRVYGLRYKCACFTNLYEDHISQNEHPDMEDYLNCKLRLFDNCEYGIINRDCHCAGRVTEYAEGKCRIVTYGLEEGADVRAVNLRKERRGHITGTGFTIVSPFYNGELFVALPGEFNVYNALCAICCAGVLGVGFESVKSALAVVSVPGRVQPVPNSLGISILVDYAHNAAALESVISTLREYTEGRLITLFGCGGNRARSRRFEMGETSGRLSDITIITSDNPRKEEPAAILADIRTGIDKTDGYYEIIEDRTEAIYRAIAIARKGDTVLIAGKGHEDYQIFADRTIHYDDFEVAGEAVEKAEAGRL
ncbi:MAG: UDP-N-acetylmuramoyl-L-alanyl-D-glutamate--2,6-diaminopimelate ligase [Saccharofermentans sp.]|jgi:UDP-N-acetylmuramoyl-L-alanyl-D-glutamate--2,6-diaminopimelate ligase|nr:UDP-N-acetylmuramoyl-L-alanyl-D-glutamate--2,6-diaminopimelate ligase [Saccharofermentans sp.]